MALKSPLQKLWIQPLSPGPQCMESSYGDVVSQQYYYCLKNLGFSRKPNGISFAAIGFILHPALRSCLQDLIFCWQFFGFLRRIIGARSTVVFTMDVGDLQIAENRIPLLSDPSPKELQGTVLKITLKNTIVQAKFRIGYTDPLRYCANGFMEVCCQKQEIDCQPVQKQYTIVIKVLVEGFSAWNSESI